jgi:hypothetical protein
MMLSFFAVVAGSSAVSAVSAAGGLSLFPVLYERPYDRRDDPYENERNNDRSDIFS